MKCDRKSALTTRLNWRFCGSNVHIVAYNMAVTVSRLQRTVHRLAATLFGPIVRLGKADFTNATIEGG